MADVTFAEVLERLGRIRGQLEGTSSPEEVLRLEDEAEALAERGREVLERRVGQRVAQRSAHPTVQDDWPPAAQQESQAPAAVRPSWPGDVGDVERPTEVVARQQPQNGAPTDVVAGEQQSDQGAPTQVVDLTDAGADPAADTQPAEPATEARDEAAARPAGERPSSAEQPTEIFRTVD